MNSDHDKDDKEALAAEYVLGTLDVDDRANAQMLMAIDPGFTAMVASWERRLGELNELMEPVEPPKGSWQRIQARLAAVEPGGPIWLPGAEELRAPAVRAPDPPPAVSADPTAADAAPAGAETAGGGAEIVVLAQRLRRWRRVTAAVGALAAVLVAVVVARELRPDMMPPALRPAPLVVERPVEVVKTVEVPSPRMAEYVAVLQPDAATPAFLLTFDLDKRMVSVRKVGAPAQSGKSYELWLVSDRMPAPRSLGTVGEQDFTVRRALQDYDMPMLSNATYAISLEPEGGSPTGVPTGPVMYAGKLIQATPPAFPQATP
jgi:anti-sigma-K factor RskA